MGNKKSMENALLAVIGIGLITTAVVLLSKKRSGRSKGDGDEKKITSYEDYEDNPLELRSFSETGIYL